MDRHACFPNFQTDKLTNLLCAQLKLAVVIGSVIHEIEIGITRVVICKVVCVISSLSDSTPFSSSTRRY